MRCYSLLSLFPYFPVYYKTYGHSHCRLYRIAVITLDCMDFFSLLRVHIYTMMYYLISCSVLSCYINTLVLDNKRYIFYIFEQEFTCPIWYTSITYLLFSKESR